MQPSPGGAGFVEGAVAEHREQDVGLASGEAEQGLGVGFALADLLVVVGAGCRVAQGRERGGKKARLCCLFPLREGCLLRMEVLELRVAGASPA